MATRHANDSVPAALLTPERYRTLAGDGVAVSLARFPGDRTRRVPVVLTHGTFSNGRICFRLARYLAENGFDCWVLELRGHGDSERLVPRPDFEAFGLLDVPAALECVRKHTGHPDALLVGHSGGGLAFLMHLARRQDSRAAICGLVMLASQATDACTSARARLIIHATHVATNLLGFTPGPAFRLGPENEPQGVLRSWFRWNYTRQWIGRDGFDYLAALRDITTPALCFAGGGDRVIAPAQGCRRLFDALGTSDKQWVLCGTSAGFSEDFGHARIVASRAAEREIWPRIKDWLVDHS
jgi:oxygen-independent coproporphyrinogen-3 oxidase